MRGFIPHGTLYFFTGVQRVRCPCLRNGLLPFQHGGLWSWASHVRRELLRAVGLHPLSKWSARSARLWTVQQHTVWPGGRGVGRPLGLPRVRDVLPGRGGLDRTTKAPEPTGRAACCPLRVCQPTAPYGVRPARTGTPGCRAGMRSLRSDQPRARTVYCAVGVYPAVRTPTISCYERTRDRWAEARTGPGRLCPRNGVAVPTSLPKCPASACGQKTTLRAPRWRSSRGTAPHRKSRPAAQRLAATEEWRPGRRRAT